MTEDSKKYKSGQKLGAWMARNRFLSGFISGYALSSFIDWIIK